MGSSSKKPCREKQGTAMLEALISLPLFVAALGGIVALGGMYGAKLEAKSRARRMAWLQADSGECPKQSCGSGLCGRIEGEIRAGGLDDLLRVDDGGFSLGSFVGDVSRFFLGNATHGVGLAEAPIPSMVSSGTTSQHGVMTLLCNTTSRQTEGGTNVLEHACQTGLRATEYAREACN